MLEQFKRITISQYQAALRTIENCVTLCPNETWDQPVHELTFDQALFHAVFWADLYLSDSIEDCKAQPFHDQHGTVFQGYEELEPIRPQHRYDRDFANEYIDYCVQKVSENVLAATASSLEEPVSFEWLDLSRAELHLYNIRHIQHHAAQLILRLRQEHNAEIGWVKQGE